nr:retrotransposon protein, putative, unclassified [Triticum aestivum]
MLEVEKDGPPAGENPWTGVKKTPRTNGVPRRGGSVDDAGSKPRTRRSRIGGGARATSTAWACARVGGRQQMGDGARSADAKSWPRVLEPSQPALLDAGDALVDRGQRAAPAVGPGGALRAKERRRRGGEGERGSGGNSVPGAVTGEWGQVMRHRLRLPHCPRHATALHARPCRARLARNCRFGSFRRARLRATLRVRRHSIRSHPIFSHLPPTVLQYADDTLIFAAASPAAAAAPKVILNNFAHATGLAINFSKTTLATLHTDESKTAAIALTMGC